MKYFVFLAIIVLLIEICYIRHQNNLSLLEVFLIRYGVKKEFEKHIKQTGKKTFYKTHGESPNAFYRTDIVLSEDKWIFLAKEWKKYLLINTI